MTDLVQLLLGDREAAAAWDPIKQYALPTQPTLTASAYRTAFIVTKLMGREHGAQFEWHGLNIARKDALLIVRRIEIGEQDCTASMSGLRGREVLKIGASLDSGEIINGDTHSHCFYSADFSGVDYRDMLLAVREVGKYTMQQFWQKYPLIRGEVKIERHSGKTVVSGDVNTGIRLVLRDGPARLSNRSIRDLLESAEDRIQIGWSAHAVVNALGQIGGYMMYQAYLPRQLKERIWGRPAQIKVVPDEPGTPKIDRAALRWLVKKSLTPFGAGQPLRYNLPMKLVGLPAFDTGWRVTCAHD